MRQGLAVPQGMGSGILALAATALYLQVAVAEGGAAGVLVAALCAGHHVGLGVALRHWQAGV